MIETPTKHCQGIDSRVEGQGLETQVTHIAHFVLFVYYNSTLLSMVRESNLQRKTLCQRLSMSMAIT